MYDLAFQKDVKELNCSIVLRPKLVACTIQHCVKMTRAGQDLELQSANLDLLIGIPTRPHD